MTTSITFRVNYQPVPQPRPRARVVFQNGQPRPAIYEDGKHPVKLWKLQVLDAWRLVMPSPGFRFDGPLSVRMVSVTARPASMIWKRKPMPREWDTRKSSGDADNVVKSVLDALNGKAWHDDSQVIRLDVWQMIAAGDEEPHALIKIAIVDTPPCEWLLTLPPQPTYPATY